MAVHNGLKFNYTKILRKVLKLWRINIGIPVLIIQILKIFGLNLNTTYHNPPIPTSRIIQTFLRVTSQSSSLRFVNHPVFLKSFNSVVNPPNFPSLVLLIPQFRIVNPPVLLNTGDST